MPTEDEWLRDIREAMGRRFAAESLALLDDPSMDRPLREQKKQIRKKLRDHGTDVDLNDRDVTGDGDQSLITLGDNGKQVYRDLYAVGGDIDVHFTSMSTRNPAMSEFGFKCAVGDHQFVQMFLEMANNDMKQRKGSVSPALVNVLEKRETSMRLSPLLCIVSMGKNVVGANSENQLHVVRLLLLYGARPDAKDVVGKTVCHYGAGVMATPMTMEAVRMCSAAAESSHLFGKEVVLRGLNAEGLNGKRGVARGYVVSSSRRVVYLIDDEKELAVKPENIALVNNEEGSAVQKPKLCDLQDRLGGTALVEVTMSGRVDVAIFLLDELGASVEIADSDGCSPKSMIMHPGGQFGSAVAPLIMKATMKRARQEKKGLENRCSNCGIAGTSEKPLQLCARCNTVGYCSKACQVAHWKGGHKQECTKKGEEYERSIVLDTPRQDPRFTTMVSWSTGKVTTSAGTFKKPDNVAVDETFYVKIQCNGLQTPVLIYDKSRQCEFSYHPDQKGFQEIAQKVLAEKASNGRKAYMSASFGADGKIRLYPNKTTILKW